MAHERKWWVAALFTLAQPGLGQIYNGQLRKGVGLFALTLAILFCMPLLALFSSYRLALAGFAVLSIAVLLYIVTDAIGTARRFGANYHLKSVNKPIVYIAFCLCFFGLTQAATGYIKHNHLQAFKIPSNSNSPTILPGDHILVDRSTDPQTLTHGDMIVFDAPDKPNTQFIKRVVALGGDRIGIEAKKLTVNGTIVDEPFAARTAAMMPTKRDFMDEIEVPEGHVFVLGDNRDFSLDSRFFGAIAHNKVKGTVNCIYWSWDKNASKVRWKRIGQAVH